MCADRLAGWLTVSLAGCQVQPRAGGLLNAPVATPHTLTHSLAHPHHACHRPSRARLSPLSASFSPLPSYPRPRCLNPTPPLPTPVHPCPSVCRRAFTFEGANGVEVTEGPIPADMVAAAEAARAELVERVSEVRVGAACSRCGCGWCRAGAAAATAGAGHRAGLRLCAGVWCWCRGCCYCCTSLAAPFTLPPSPTSTTTH